MIHLHFLGAAGTVTGSRFLLEIDSFRVLIDCGLFQGLKEIREQNWSPFPRAASSINAVVLTHAHIDHTGFLPRLVREGFSGPVWATEATADLLEVMLPDSARLQEEDAEFANRQNFSVHSPALPLYTEADARAALRLMNKASYRQKISLTPTIEIEFAPAGHILGSSVIRVTVQRANTTPLQVLFSGDLGRYGEPILPDPTPVPQADYLIMESTYGNRKHAHENPKERLAEIINRTVQRGGTLLIPAFAVGRTQLVLYLIRELEEENRIPVVPVAVDSPMAVRATALYGHHRSDHDFHMWKQTLKGRDPLSPKKLELCETVQDSKQLMAEDRPAIIISASGMATGGRILHHLKKHLPDPRATVALVGYQAEGTRGHRLQRGETQLKIHGELVPVRATVESIGSLSAHADCDELLRWLGHFERAPKKTFLVHGEPEGTHGLRDRIRTEKQWEVAIPSYGDKVELI